MTAITARVELVGPFFARDPGKTVAQNITAMLREIAQAVEGSVRRDLQAGEPGRAVVRGAGAYSRVSRSVRGRVESLSGRPWHQWAVISPDRTGLSARQAIALYAAASRIERRAHVFRSVASAVRAVRADLARGLG